MALPGKIQLAYWGAAAIALTLILWTLGDALLPFVLGGAFAYFLDPVADRLERAGLSRLFATILISLGAILILVLLLLLILPLIIGQIAELVRILPEVWASARSTVATLFPSINEAGSPFRQSLEGLSESAQSQTGELIAAVFDSAMSVLRVFIVIIVAPVVTFYLLLDWDRMVARIDELLPREHAPTIRRLAADIDVTLSSFLRGQGTVCLILGVFYSVALTLAGLNFGVAIGAIAGFLTFIPYVGSFVGGTLAIGLGLFQFWGDWAHIALIAAIFLGGQLVEGNFLTPYLVGSSVRLHPVWLLVALSVFGALFGFVGMLVAVPVTAALGVLARFGVEKYKGSILYRGETDTAGE